MKKIDLNGRWKARCRAVGDFEGTVPGCATTDLINCGFITEDIYYRDNAKKIRWIENEDFIYEKIFTVDRTDGNPILVFECLDTYAEIFLNGEKIAETDDMFVIYRFPVEGKLKKGRNLLKVVFKSPVKKTEGLPDRGAAFTYERLYTRREQCTYGWDWVYRFVTCGIQRPCYIVYDSLPAVDSVYVSINSVDEEFANITVTADIKNSVGEYIDISILSPDGQTVYSSSRYCKEDFFIEYITIDKPLLWYPLGYGEHPLYSLRIDVQGEIFEEKFGIRTVSIIQRRDLPREEYHSLCRKLQQTKSGQHYDKNETYSSFILCVNGRKIFCRGANWVPCDPFISNESDEKITRLLETGAEGGFNMLRIWGGGVFEKDFFYSECDRLGIMVTQDFLMACGKYPEEDDGFIEKLSLEAKCAALRLRNHPCLMWWSGDNENAVDGAETIPEYNGRRAALSGIAPVLRKYDPNRYFLPSSPYGGDRYASKTRGTTHNTQFLGNTTFPYIIENSMEDYKEYYSDNYLARFVAEEPVLGACAEATLRHFMTSEDITGENTEMWYFHTQNNPGLPIHLLKYAEIFAEKVFGSFKDGKDRFFKLRYLQCEWSRIGMENFRRNMFFSSGLIYWMFNDCWPAAAGWAFLDYYCRPKDSFYAFRRQAGDISASAYAENGRVNLSISSTLPRKAEFTARLYDIDYGFEKIIGVKTYDISCESDQAKIFAAELPMPEGVYVLDIVSEGKIIYRTFLKNGFLHIKETYGYEITSQTESSVTVKAKTYIQSLFADAEGKLSDSAFIMLPGEERTVSVDGKGSIRITAFGLE